MGNVIGVHHIGLAVADLAASCDFYCSCGYAVSDRLHLTGADPAIGNGLDATVLDIAFLASPAMTLELLQFDPAGRPLSADDPCFGSVPVANDPPAELDPDGHPLSRSAATQTNAIFTTAVPEQTRALLEVLGFVSDGEATLSAYGLTVELVTVAAQSPAPTANCPGRMHLCCQVADIDAAVAVLAEAGFATVSTPRVSGDLSWVFVAHEGGPGIELLSVAG